MSTTISADFETEHLTDEQRKIAMTIIKTLFGDRLYDEEMQANNSGCQAFYRPDEWQGEYGRESELVVNYDGGDLYYFISMDGCYAMSCMMAADCYSSLEKVQAALREIGYYMEECTRNYSAVYKV